MWPAVWSLVLGFMAFILFDFLSSCFTERSGGRNLHHLLRNSGQGRSELKPQAQKRCVEDSADASLRAQRSENTGPGRMMPFDDAQRTKFCPKRAESK
jgi:hypothetical protein